VPRIQVHDLGHTHATHLLAAGVNVKVRQRTARSRVGGVHAGHRGSRDARSAGDRRGRRRRCRGRSAGLMITRPLDSSPVFHFVVDTNFINDPTPAVRQLRALNDDGTVYLSRTDTLGTELARAKGERGVALRALADEHVEHRGPIVRGVSRWDTSVWPTADDEARLDRVFAVCFPGSHRDADRSNNLRDAMHIATSIRYGAQGFITRDKRILRRAVNMRTAFDAFVVTDPEGALEIVERLASRRADREHRKTASDDTQETL
jgi:hypothetical protein